MLTEAPHRRQTAMLVNVTSGDHNFVRLLIEDGTVLTLSLGEIYSGPLPLPIPHDDPKSARKIWRALGVPWLGSLWEWDGVGMVPSEAVLAQFMERLPLDFVWPNDDAR